MIKILVTVVAVYCALCITTTSCQEGLSQNCVGCICHASSTCDASFGCQGGICGPFQLSYDYWVDGGMKTVSGQNPNDPTAYSSCANDVYCAAEAVKGYMQNFQQDCNGDGAITCEDYVTMHKVGRFGCPGTLPNWYLARFEQCKGSNQL